MSGMETLRFHFTGTTTPAPFAAVLVGVVASGNLEVMIEPHADAASCEVRVDTSARGFGDIWEAVLDDFHSRHPLGGITISINDMGATPAVVSLRLDQAASAMNDAATSRAGVSNAASVDAGAGGASP